MEVIGKIFGKVSTNKFSFLANKEIRKFDYVKVWHPDYSWVLAQIMDVERNENKIIGKCRIIGYREEGILKTPLTPLKNGDVLEADPDFISQVLGIKRDGLYLGLMWNKPLVEVKLDTKKVLTKHVAVLAKTGAGKSYVSGVLVEELLEKGFPVLIFDPHGEYSSLQIPNKNPKELQLMNKYGISPKGYKIKELIPGKNFFISLNSLDVWEIQYLTPFKLSQSAFAVLYEAWKKAKTFEDLIYEVETAESKSKFQVLSALNYLKDTNFFSEEEFDVKDLIEEGVATIINLKGISPYFASIITAKVLSQLFMLRKKGELSSFFVVLEEAHNFCPERGFGEVPSSRVIRTIASEGRKFGIGLLVISQRPARIDKNVLSQCNTQIILKVTNPNDLKAIATSSEGITGDIIEEIKNLPIGVGIVISYEFPILTSIRVRRSQHGGYEKLGTKTKVVKLSLYEKDKDGAIISWKTMNEAGYFVEGEIDGEKAKALLDNELNLLIVINGELYRIPIKRFLDLKEDELKLIRSILIGKRTLGDFFSLFKDLATPALHLQKLAEKGIIQWDGKKAMFSDIFEPLNHFPEFQNIEIEEEEAIKKEFKFSKAEIKEFLEKLGFNVKKVERIMIVS